MEKSLKALTELRDECVESLRKSSDSLYGGSIDLELHELHKSCLEPQIEDYQSVINLIHRENVSNR